MSVGYATYHRSALAAALVRMWRAWTVIVPVVVVNAALQALLVWPDVTPARNASTVALATVSACVFGIALALLTASALLVPFERVTWHAAMTVLRGRWVAFALWASALLVALLVAVAITAPLAVIVPALLPFVLLAALDGDSNPMAVNFRTIGRRFWRWLVTSVIVALIVLVGSALTGVTQFFLRGSFGSFIVWLVGGLVSAWLTVAWGLIYAKAKQAVASGRETGADPDLEPA